jgi:PKD repeat protein
VQIVAVANVAPSVTAAADQTAAEGASKTFALGSFSDPGPDSPWAVDVNWGDGSTHTTFSASSTGSLGTRAHTYDDGPATRTVTVKVTDKNGDSDSKTFQVTVANVAPVVTAPSDHTADEGATKDFGLGSFSDPGADKPWAVDVNWGDGSASTHFTVDAAGSLGLAPHAYADNGSYTVTVAVTDKDGAWDAKSYTVVVSNVAPTAKLSNNSPITEGGSATIAFSEPADPSSVDTAAGFRYAIRCDGSVPTVADAGPAASKSCSFADNGTKTVKGIVVDKDGGSREYSTDVTVTNVAPTVTAAANQTATEGSSQSFTLGSFGDPGANDSPWKVSVNWGDSPVTQSLADQTSTGSLGSASHTYADNGSYTVSVTVTDKDLGKDTKTFTVVVANVKPTITSFSGTDYLAGANAYVGGGGVSSTLTTKFTDPGSDTWTGAFTYQDGLPLTASTSPFTTGQTVSHTFASAGCKSASVKVTDDDGGYDTATTTIKVGTGAFQPPMTNQPVTDKLKNGQVLPVKVHVSDCSGVAATTLTPAIRLVKGDATPQNDDAATTITPPSVSAADTTGVMRSSGGGDYIYNMQVNLPTLNTDYTVVVYPYGTGSPVQLGHVIQATK